MLDLDAVRRVHGEKLTTQGDVLVSTMKDLYEIVDANALLSTHLKRQQNPDPSGTSVLATKQYNAVEFRDESLRTVYHYKLPEIAVLQSPFWHYFKDFAYHPAHLAKRRIKFRFIRQCLLIIRKIGAIRERCTILEIGATLGENYRILKYMVEQEPYPMTIEYVGIDKDINATAFARELFADDPNVQSVNANATTLDQFPDRTFDLVISNTVNNRLDINHFANPLLEAYRVSRFACVFQLMINTEPSAGLGRLQSAAIAEEGYHVPSFDHVLSILEKRAPLYVYRPSLDWVWGEKFDRAVEDQRYLASDLPL